MPKIKQLILSKYKDFKKEISGHKFIYIFLVLLIGVAIFLRTYRVDQLLWFFYDQGRDALVVWDFIKTGKLFLIGPTTGLEGIFRGPFYYYLISPAYFIGKGDPATAAAFLGILNAFGLILVFALAVNISRFAGLIAVFLGAISFNWVRNDRWLSNPSPISFFGPLTLLFLYLSSKNSKYFIWVGLLLGLNFQMETSGTVFTLFAVIVWVIYQKIYRDIKSILISVGLFLATFLPQAVFDIRHDFLITKSFFKFMQTGNGSGSSFGIPTAYQFDQRLNAVYSTFIDKIEFNPSSLGLVLLIFILVVLLISKKLRSVLLVKLLLIWILVPVILVFFYRGNFERFYGYYFNSLIPAFFLLIGLVFVTISKNIVGKVITLIFLTLFFLIQWQILPGYLNDKLEGSNTIALGNQVKAIDWIYNDAGEKQFNTDVYVPPVVPYAYNYLFKYLSDTRYNRLPEEKLVENLYTIREYDSDQKRIEAWIRRQDGIGSVEKVATFGGITVEKRKRIKYEN